MSHLTRWCVVAALAAGTMSACSADADPPAQQSAEVATATYNLGNTAFKPPGFRNAIELAGVVHYPKDLGTKAHPMVMMLHGAWTACVKEGQRAQWPCPPGVAQIDSFRGYDYLGEHLAKRGYIVVSISANGINETENGDGYDARRALLNKQLQLWQQLSATGHSPLVGKLVDATTGKPAAVDFAHHVDMTDVATIGHSRGGQAVMEQASDRHRKEWPHGVQIKAVLGLAPTTNGADGRVDPITSLPLLTIIGSCDGAISPYVTSEAYFNAARGRSKARIEKVTVPGANHNFFNTSWSPSGGRPRATDDSPATGPHQCTTSESDAKDVRKLSETEQRQVATTYITAYVDRFLRGDMSADDVLTGKRRPDGVPSVDLTVDGR
ncbi:alpha/beta hydrolase family protein [Luteipulveratus mongoliensis]|uniref:Alpha/beta hydrolase n=1 Tax=Luteipulveratus mongoliensis TaxID=571913 RepID=A0A0K1JE81_9MICO|nr:alpha/beta hydrolase [Luteipulveratus mongoliensis]AKU14895.1 hypothetical protein VV02_01810 [Luteipulveratus mongoliensis]